MNEEEKTGKSSRLGKEAKIGVTVILVLLLVFAAAVVVRLSGSGSGDELAAAAQDAGKAKHPAGNKIDDGFMAVKPKPHVGNPPTLVLAKADPAPAPKANNHEFDKWKVASDKSEPKPVEGKGPMLISPPPLPPEPSRPLPGSRYDGTVPDRLPERAKGPKHRQDHADSPPILPDDKPRHRAGSGESASDLRETSGYTSLGAPPPAPPYREHNRYDNSGTLPPPPDRSQANISDQSVPSDSVSQYGGSDYSQRPSRPMYDDPPRRRTSSRSFDGPTALGNDGKYEVQPLDSFWTISEKLYGTGAYFKALTEHNRGKDGEERQLKPGDIVLTPPVEQLEKSYPDLCPKPSRRETLRNRAMTVGTRRQYRSGRTYTVAEGDTLFDIARYELGKAARWVEIYELNRDVLGADFNYITPGTQLMLPESGRPDVLAEPPGDRYRR